MHGLRGVDFKLENEVHVILAFNPKNFYDIVQALGRGSRSFFQVSNGTIVFPESADKMKIDPERLMEYFKKMQSEESTIETLRMNLLQAGHGQELRGKSDQYDGLIKIFKEKLSIYYVGEDADEQAVENWKTIKTLFPKETVGQTPIEHIQGEIQKE
jgi:hypothetical protein